MGIWRGWLGVGVYNTGTVLSHIKSSNFNVSKGCLCKQLNGVVIYSLAMLFVGLLATRPLENTYFHF